MSHRIIMSDGAYLMAIKYLAQSVEGAAGYIRQWCQAPYTPRHLLQSDGDIEL